MLPEVLHLLLQAAEALVDQPAADPLGPFKSLLIPMLVIFLIFYLIVFRPESRKRKERQQMIANVKKGDSVVTTGGILGKVWRVDKDEVVVIVDKDKDVKVRFAKSAIFEVLLDAAASGKEGETAASPAAEEVRK